MSKLLNKPLRAFAAFAAIILFCSIPVYFFIIESIWIDELDDHNQGIKTQVHKGFAELNNEDFEKSIILWNKIHPESKLSENEVVSEDSVYTTEREVMDGSTMETERFRGLLSTIDLNGRQYRIRIETNVEEVDETVSAISLVTCAFITLLILGFVILNRQLSKKIWRPFIKTLEKLKHFDLSNASGITFEDTDITEFKELNDTLDTLIKNNISVFQQHKEFTQNASHELQTPLALLKSKLDLLIQSATLTEDQRSIISSLERSVSRITRINNNLLLLARIENKSYESTSIDLTSMVRSIADVFKEYSEKGKREISAQCEDGVRITANEGLAEIMVNNLLSNAIRHGSEDTTVSLKLTKHSFSIMNGSSSALNADALFKRFISAGSQTQGTGLGLAIVKEICDKYGWTISYVYADGRHNFSIAF